jgi:hypothetical protein
MKLRIPLWLGVGVVTGASLTAGSTLWAQQSLRTTPSVITPNGYLVEEVRVGQSCVVIVAKSGPPTDQVAAITCSR